MREELIDAINDFCLREYGVEADLTDPCHIPIAYSTSEDETYELQVLVNIDYPKLYYYANGIEVYEERFNCDEELIYQLQFEDFFNVIIGDCEWYARRALEGVEYDH